MAEVLRADSTTKKRKFRLFGKKRNKNKSDASVYTIDEPPVANKQQVKFAAATNEITAAEGRRPQLQESNNMLRKSILHNNCKAPVDQRLQTTKMRRSWLGQTRFFKNIKNQYLSLKPSLNTIINQSGVNYCSSYVVSNPTFTYSKAQT